MSHVGASSVVDSTDALWNGAAAAPNVARIYDTLLGGTGNLAADQAVAGELLRLVPDVQTRVVRTAIDGDTIWTEMEHSGTRLDGSPHLLRGVVIFGVNGGLATWARFFMEPVQEGSGGVDEAIRQQLGSGGRP